MFGWIDNNRALNFRPLLRPYTSRRGRDKPGDDEEERPPRKSKFAASGVNQLADAETANWFNAVPLFSKSRLRPLIRTRIAASGRNLW